MIDNIDSLPSQENANNKEITPNEIVNSINNFFEKNEYNSGNCQDNIRSLLLNLKNQNFDLNKLKVLYITRPIIDIEPDSSEPNMVFKNTKDGIKFFSFHVALEHSDSGKIFDLSSNSHNGETKEDFFKNSFLSDKLSISEKDPAKKRRIINKAKRLSITNYQDLCSQIYIKSINPNDYLNNTYDEINKKSGMIKSFWFDISKNISSQSLGDYLKSNDNFVKLVEPKEKEVDPYLAEYYYTHDKLNEIPNSIEIIKTPNATILYNQQFIELGDFTQVPNAISYCNPLLEIPAHINRTNRDLENIKKIYSPEMLNIDELKDKIVLDIGTGGGLFPEQLREKGVIAYGMDLVLSNTQKESMLANSYELTDNSIILPQTLESNIFIAGDACDTHIANEQVDVIYDTYGVYEYLFYKSEKLGKIIFNEWKRILKPGGKIRFGTVGKNSMEKVSQFFEKIEWGSKPIFYPMPGENSVGIVEITKN